MELPRHSGRRGSPRLIWHKRRASYYIRWSQHGKSMVRGTGTAVLEEAEESFRQFLSDPEEYDRTRRAWAKPMLPPRSKTGTIYFIGCDEVDRVKIGYARSEVVRLSELQCGSPVTLKILAATTGTMEDERDYHVRFSSSRLHGEWFERCPEIAAEIERLNRGSPPLYEKRGRITLADKILSRIVVDDASGCWNWQRSKLAGGYGCVYWEHKPRAAHRAMFESVKGPIPPGVQIYHLCRNPTCCNPDHLEATTPGEHTPLAPMAPRRERATHCKHGHAFTPENSYFDPRGVRSCKECRRIRNEAWSELRRQRRASPHDAPTIETGQNP